MTARERVARAWHEGSDHAADEPFGGPLCNCEQVADRVLPMLSEAWERCANHILASCTYATSTAEEWRHTQLINDLYKVRDIANPYQYETEEVRHVDQ